MDEPKITVHTVKMHDTGLGREAGFKDDAELIEAAEAERETWEPWMRELAERVDAEFERKVLFGE